MRDVPSGGVLIGLEVLDVVMDRGIVAESEVVSIEEKEDEEVEVDVVGGWAAER